jgi:hypothetical protein
MKTRTYCAIIGDINKSRALLERVKIQRRFQKAVETINKEYEQEIASKFILTLGDEFQGLLRTPRESYRLVRRFQDIMGDVPFAFGIGVGILSTRLKNEALGMDGECFHRARAALQQAKKSKIEVVFDFEHSFLQLVNTTVALLEKEWKLLNPKQKKIAQLMKEFDHQQTVAKKINVTQQYISKALRTTVMKEMNNAEKVLYQFLESI